MKKILYLLAIPAVAVAMSTSCSDLNTYPVFDDANAFVAFGQVTATVSEDAGEVKIPIVLSSVAGISTSITYELVDSTAKAGTDYIVPDDLTATFSADHRIDTITIPIINRPGAYTKDLVFTVRITNTGTVTDGAANECIVTITDLDHPLAYITGSYNVTAGDGQAWTMTLTPDEGDETMIWIYDICNLGSWAADDMLYYGVVNTEDNTISIPVGQGSEYTYSNGNPVLLCVTDMQYIYYGGVDPISATISDNGNTIVIEHSEYPAMYMYIQDAGMINYASFPFTATK